MRFYRIDIWLGIISTFLVLLSCQSEKENQFIEIDEDVGPPYLVVLGNVQDGGSPHMGCSKNCCKELFENPDPERKVVSLGFVDPTSKMKIIFEATPDFASQAKRLKVYAPFENSELPDAIFLTHAHIGHYTGLMYLGKEALGTNLVPVYAMKQMKTFLENNGPWDQLVTNGNIRLIEIKEDSTCYINENLLVTPLKVPHRDEYSETVGYKIVGPSKTVLFIPDIDKWEKWDRDIVNEIENVDYAFIDGTFYDGEEINHRDISQIPHPFIIESMALFSLLSNQEKSKIHFIHFNHTNPLLNPDSEESKLVIEQGFRIARLGMKFEL